MKAQARNGISRSSLTKRDHFRKQTLEAYGQLDLPSFNMPWGWHRLPHELKVQIVSELDLQDGKSFSETDKFNWCLMNSIPQSAIRQAHMMMKYWRMIELHEEHGTMPQARLPRLIKLIKQHEALLRVRRDPMDLTYEITKRSLDFMEELASVLQHSMIARHIRFFVQIRKSRLIDITQIPPRLNTYYRLSGHEWRNRPWTVQLEVTKVLRIPAILVRHLVITDAVWKDATVSLATSDAALESVHFIGCDFMSTSAVRLDLFSDELQELTFEYCTLDLSFSGLKMPSKVGSLLFDNMLWDEEVSFKDVQLSLPSKIHQLEISGYDRPQAELIQAFFRNIQYVGSICLPISFTLEEVKLFTFPDLCTDLSLGLTIRTLDDCEQFTTLQFPPNLARLCLDLHFENLDDEYDEDSQRFLSFWSEQLRARHPRTVVELRIDPYKEPLGQMTKYLDVFEALGDEDLHDHGRSEDTDDSEDDSEDDSGWSEDSTDSEDDSGRSEDSIDSEDDSRRFEDSTDFEDGSRRSEGSIDSEDDIGRSSDRYDSGDGFITEEDWTEESSGAMQDQDYRDSMGGPAHMRGLMNDDLFISAMTLAMFARADAFGMEDVYDDEGNCYEYQFPWRG